MLLLLCAGFALGGAAQAVTVVQTDMNCAVQGPDIARNPNSEYNLIWGGNNCTKYNTNWVFNSWATATTPPATGGNPALDISANGNAYHVALYTSSGVDRIFPYKSTTQGNTWSASGMAIAMRDGQAVDGFFSSTDHICTVAQAAAVSTQPAIIYPRIVTDKNTGSSCANDLYVIALAYAFDGTVCRTDRLPFVTRSTDGGATWSLPTAVHELFTSSDTDQDAAALISDPATDADGRVLVAGVSNNPENGVACGRGIRVGESTDCGISGFHVGNSVGGNPPSCAFANAIPISPPGPAPFPDIGHPDTAHIASVPGQSGTWYIVFRGRSDSHTHDTHIWFVKTTDTGAHWTTPIKVDSVAIGANDDGSGTFCTNTNINGCTRGQKLAISVAANGRIDVIWGDPRNGAGGDDYYYNYSTDSGATFAATDTRLTTGGLSIAVGALAPATPGVSGSSISLVSGGTNTPGVAFAAYDGQVSGVTHSYMTGIAQ